MPEQICHVADKYGIFQHQLTAHCTQTRATVEYDCLSSFFCTVEKSFHLNHNCFAKTRVSLESIISHSKKTQLRNCQGNLHFFFAYFFAKWTKISFDCMCSKLQKSHFGERLPYTSLCGLGYALNCLLNSEKN